MPENDKIVKISKEDMGWLYNWMRMVGNEYILYWLAILCDLESDRNAKWSDQLNVPSNTLTSMDSKSTFIVDQE